jgi:hypothetical protein
MKNYSVIFNTSCIYVLELVFTQGNTTSSINGVVYDNGGKLCGSINFGYSLRIGTRYSGSTDFSGILEYLT